jgi:hypothetical protein
VPNDAEQSRPATPRPEGPEAEIKVTDRRMFTPSGELREEYRHLEDAPPPKPEAPRQAAGPPPAGTASPSPGQAPGAGAATAPPPPGPDRTETPPGGAPAGGGPGAAGRPEAQPPEAAGPAGAGGPGILDLVGMLVESAAVYLGDARLPDGGSAEDLELARFHIDLLDVLRRKTAGNLSTQESAALDDVLYRLRMRYVQKQG